MTQSYGDLWRLIRFAKPSVPTLGLVGVTAVLSAGATLWFPMLTKRYIDQLTVGVTHWDGIAAIVAVLTFGAVIGAISHYMLSRVGYEVVAVLRHALVEKLLALPVRAFDQTDTDERVSRVIHNCDSISDLVASQVINFLNGILVLGGSIVCLFLLDSRLTLTLLVCLLASFFAVVPITTMLSNLTQQVQERTASLSGILTHALSEIRLVKAFTAERRERERSREQIDGLKAIGLTLATMHVTLAPLTTLTISTALVVVLALGAARAATGDIGIGTLTAYGLYIFNIAQPMAALTRFASELLIARGAAMRISGILQEAAEEMNSGGDTLPLDGALEFDNVSFQYQGSENQVLAGVSLVFNPGSTTALVGVSGSGKTTVLSLIERFYNPTSGDIFYNGKPVNDYAIEAWRRSIGYVAQNAPVMPGTIRQNITYGLVGERSDADVRAAAKLAGALDFIENMPEGLDSILIEQGNNVSGEQRQRLAIARMFLRDPNILILDEATSNLDSDTELQVRAALRTLMQGRTNIIVAHRLSTVMHTDRIYFLEDGRISGVGNHRELLSSHPPYARLVEQQFHSPPIRKQVSAGH